MDRKDNIKRYSRVLVISSLILGVLGYFWYNSIVFEEDKISLFLSILYSCLFFGIIGIFLFVRNTLFLGLIGLSIVWIYGGYILFSTTWMSVPALFFGENITGNITSKLEKEINRNYGEVPITKYIINYEYTFDSEMNQKKENVSRNIYNIYSTGDSIDLKVLGKNTMIQGNIPILYLIAGVMYPFLILFFIKWGISYIGRVESKSQ